MELFSFVFMLFLGTKFLLAKSVTQAPVHLGATADKLEVRIEEKLHPHSAFMTGFVRVVGNLRCWYFRYSTFGLLRQVTFQQALIN